MKMETFRITSKCDNLPLGITVMEPEGDCRGVVQISHGMAEHKERYYGFMEYLAKEGYASVINDHRGHGASVRNEDDLGFFYDDRGESIVEDLHQITLYIKERFSGKPVFLFGHSMGSIAARVYIKKYDDCVDKLILSGAPCRNPLVNLAKLLVKLQASVKGDRYRSPIMYSLFLGSFEKAVDKGEKPSAWLSVNKENVEEYERDPLCGFRFTLNGYLNLASLLSDAFSSEGWQMKNRGLDILFLAGEKDPVIGGEKAWHGSRDFLKERGYEKVSGKLYNNMRHEILLETDKENVYKDIVAFLQGGKI